MSVGVRSVRGTSEWCVAGGERVVAEMWHLCLPNHFAPKKGATGSPP